MIKKLTITTLIFILCSLSLSGCSKQSAQQGMPPFVISTTKVKAIDWQETIEATGSLSAFSGITVKSETSGRVTQIYFKSGQYIEKGQPLVQIYPNTLRAELQKATADYQLARRNYQRYLKLYQQHFYSKANLDSAHSDLKAKQATVDQIQSQLSQTLIVAPFSGKVGLRQISLGDYLSPGDSIVDLESLDPIRVDFSIPEVYLNQVQIGDKVTMAIQAYPKKTFTGKIYAFNSAVDSSSRSLDVWASSPNPNHELLPGTFAETTVYLGQPQHVLVVPQAAIDYEESGNYVFEPVNHKAVKTKVTLGNKLQKDSMVIITSGLKEGDVIVSDGVVKLTDGAPLMTTEEAQQMAQGQNKGQAKEQNKKPSKKQSETQSNDKTAKGKTD